MALNAGHASHTCYASQGGQGWGGGICSTDVGANGVRCSGVVVGLVASTLGQSFEGEGCAAQRCAVGGADNLPVGPHSVCLGIGIHRGLPATCVGASVLT